MRWLATDPISVLELTKNEVDESSMVTDVLIMSAKNPSFAAISAAVHEKEPAPCPTSNSTPRAFASFAASATL